MAEIDPNKPQVTDPITVADLVRVLSVRGSLGVLDVADVILPTISVGQITPLEVAIRTPAFRSTDIFSAGSILAPVAGTLLADTGALPAGTYDLTFVLSNSGITSNTAWQFEHRNAADTANLATFPINTGRSGSGTLEFSIGYELATNERIRIITANDVASQRWAAAIFARIRT